jgi:membrane-bound ClpP family serine protease
VDVVTEGPPVEQGTPIKVVAIEGLRVVVRAV